MHKLIIKYKEQVKMLHLRNGKTYTISDDSRANVTLPGLTLPIRIEQNVEGGWQANHSTIHRIQRYTTPDDQDITLMLFAEQDGAAYAYPTEDVMTIGPNAYDDITIAQLPNAAIVKGLFNLSQKGYVQIVHDVHDTVYVNYEQQTGDRCIAYIGDHVWMNHLWFEIREDGVNILTHDTVSTALIRIQRDEPNAHADDYNDYHRSPRMIHRAPTDTIKIERPPQPIQKNNTVIWRSIIPPLVMIALTVIVFLVRPIGIYILIMIGMSTVTIIFGITTYFSEKKKYKAEVAKREKDYKAYLKMKASQIYNAINEQRFSLNFHYPTLAEIKDIVETTAPRIYEKTPHHHDFLNYKLGIANIKRSFKVDYQEEEFNQRRDDLFDEAKHLYEFYEKVDQAPLVNDLCHGPIAYVGPRHLIIESLEHMLLQLATFHSYHDVEFLVVMREEEYDTFKWARWLPHMNLSNQNIRGFIYNQRTRDQLLTSVYTMIKTRIQTVRERGRSNETIQFTPQLVFVITDMALIIDHVILEYVNQDLSEYGISLVFVDDVIESLPEHVRTIVDIKSRTEGELVMKADELIQLKFTPERMDNVDKDYIARRIANINHVEHMKNAIPESVTFLQMYDVNDVAHLNVAERWRSNETYKTMAVPLGVRGKDDVLYLNLHEKAHGPHGLIAGTTGSGKSEIIQSYILSLAVNFHPHEVAFLLIDYKGGGMANLFKDLPHLVGTITNLDGDEAMRALTSIKAELRKRQRLFGIHDVNHINQYHKLVKEGIATEPMPHLFIISDEFAELKSEQPEFMKELVSTARIGRSLGIHLILATQKPSGVVDDQIWSNSKFKLALKVQDSQDSNEILKTPDAADIKLPGRAYLQVGNNEIYELFQSAFSGAPYDTADDYFEVEDKTIYQVNDYGQLEAINKDLSGLEDHEPQETQTELEAVIDHVSDVTKRLSVTPVKRPWLPPLPKIVYQSDLTETNFKKMWSDSVKEVTLTLGLKDVPEEQYQGPMTLNLKQSGHIALIGSPGYGRTTFLQSMMFNIIRQYRPDQAHMYVFDFGTNGLMPMVDVPHVADYFTVDQEEKIVKSVKRIQEMIAERKRLLSQARVVNLEQYNRYSDETLPNVFLIIDNYDTVKEAPFAESYEGMMTKITREGLALGIYIILSGSSSSTIKSAIFTNIKTRIALYLFEKNELTNIIGSYKKGVKDIKGRAAINDENFTQFQIAQPFKLADGEMQHERIAEEIKEMNTYYDGVCPTGIPMMPEKVLRQEFAQRYDLEHIIHEENKAPLGLDFEAVDLVNLDLNKPSILSCLRPDDQDLLATIVWQTLTKVREAGTTAIFIDADEDMPEYQDYASSYYSETQDLVNLRYGFKNEISQRMSGNKSKKVKKIVFINGMQQFINKTGLNESDIKLMFVDGPKVNVTVIVNGMYNDVFNNFGKEMKLCRQIIDQAVIGNQLTEQSFAKTPFIAGEPVMKEQEVYVFDQFEHKKVKLFTE